MKNLTNGNAYPEYASIIDTFRFYVMLGIVIANERPDKVNSNIDAYKKLLLENGMSQQKIQGYINRACATIPHEFNKTFGLNTIY